MKTDHGSKTEGYEAPTLTEVGSVREVTQGHFLQSGQDGVNFFGLFGS
jgi:hypothetical protein